MSHQLTSIQALRALAALVVTVAHTHVWILMATSQWGVESHVPSMATGAAGVDLFFVISGFIMVYTTRNDSGSSVAAARFFIRRLIRIVPLYWLATFAFIGYVIAIGHALAQDGISFETLIPSLLFFFRQHLHPNGVTTAPILGQGWSLNYEMAFYVTFAALMVLPRRIAIPVLLALLVGLGGWRHLIPFQFPSAAVYVTNPFLWEFACGVVIGWAYAAGVTLPRRVAVTFIVSGAVLLGAWMIDPTLLSPERAMYWEDTTMQRALQWGIPCALFAAGCVFLEYDWRGWFWRAVIFIGDASYSIYLFHALIMMLITQQAAGLSKWAIMTFSPWGYVVYLTVLAVAASALIYVAIEKPMTERLRRLMPPHRHIAAVPAE